MKLLQKVRHHVFWNTVYILSRSVYYTAVTAESALSSHNFYAIMDDEIQHDAWLIKHVHCSHSAVRCAHLAPILRRTFRSNPVQHCALLLHFAIMRFARKVTHVTSHQCLIWSARSLSRAECNEFRADVSLQNYSIQTICLIKLCSVARWWNGLNNE